MGLFPVGYDVGDRVVFHDFYLKRGQGCRCVGLVVGAPDAFQTSRDNPLPLILATDTVIVRFGKVEESHSSEMFDKVEPLDAITRLISQEPCSKHKTSL